MEYAEYNGLTPGQKLFHKAYNCRISYLRLAGYQLARFYGPVWKHGGSGVV